MHKKLLIFFYMVFLIIIPVQIMAVEKTIVISGTDWAPYNGNDLLNLGFLTEITVAALQRVNYKTNVKLVPWKRALEGTKKGLYDALMGASYTEERIMFFSYPEYSWKNKMYFFSQKGRNFKYKKTEDLCPAKLGILRGSFYIKRFESIPCLELDLANEVVLNIRKLISGRIDLLIDSNDSIMYHLNKECPNKVHLIEPVEPPFEIDKIYTIFSKKLPNYETVTEDFDKGIKLIMSEGTYDKILIKHKIY